MGSCLMTDAGPLARMPALAIVCVPAKGSAIEVRSQIFPGMYLKALYGALQQGPILALPPPHGGPKQ